VRRLVPLLLVALVALVAGIAVTGLPTHVPSDVASDELRAAPAATVTPTPTSSSDPIDSGGSLTPEPTIVERPTRSPSVSSTTRPVATSTVPITTTAPPPTTAAPAQLVVVVANAGAADLLAARMANMLAPLGYTQTAATTATERRALSAVLFAPGRDREALTLAGNIGLPAAQVQPFAGAPVTVDDARGDLWLLVGNDQLVRFNPVGVG
jgi:hypothetical protein